MVAVKTHQAEAFLRTLERLPRAILLYGTDAGLVLERAAQRDLSHGAGSPTALLERHRDRLTRANRYVDAYRHYCWPVRSVADLKLAPFHLLASEGRDRPAVLRVYRRAD